MYNSAIEISDITNLEENIALFRKEYPALLGADIERMLKAYPDDRKIKEDKLFRIVEYKPDITFICINGRLGNMNVKQALITAKKIGAKINIPNHYDMFESNSENPLLFSEKIDGGFVMEFDKEYTVSETDDRICGLQIL